MERTSLDRVFAFYYVCLTSLGIAVTLVVSVYRNEPTITYIPYLLSAFICSLYIWFGQALNTSPNQKLIIIALIFGFSIWFYIDSIKSVMSSCSLEFETVNTLKNV
ncbi:membrane hypothetical protein [Vibrio rotiferianus]|nr:membrane hypothetical protein [Vibrio rotiferianus]CAH1587649.1 membrane hypothetical protein [Vibrio rotiferianus]